MLNAEPLTSARRISASRGPRRIAPGSDRPLTFSGSVVRRAAWRAGAERSRRSGGCAADRPRGVALPAGPTGPPSSHTFGRAPRTSPGQRGSWRASSPAERRRPRPTPGYPRRRAGTGGRLHGGHLAIPSPTATARRWTRCRPGRRCWRGRCAKNQRTRHIGVVNQGISGNQVLRNGAGVSVIARFERDVLTGAA